MTFVVEMEREGAGNRLPFTDPMCPLCGLSFTPQRRNQRYCVPACQKKASRNTARGSRAAENKERTRTHYERAAWLCHDVQRTSSGYQRLMILALLEAASGIDAPLRNILLDPKLLGADRWSGIGKFYPDSRCPDTLNISKLVHVFCLEEWGVSTRQAILDTGKPAYRRFSEPTPSSTVPSLVFRKIVCFGGAKKRPCCTYDWRKLARSMRDPGWQRFFTRAELDSFL